MNAGGAGLFWAGLTPGEPIARVKAVPWETSTLVQVTNLGISVADVAQSTLCVRRAARHRRSGGGCGGLDCRHGNSVLWKGTTGRDGVAMAPALPCDRPPNSGGWRSS
jgi:hypothetical protein